MKYLFFIIICSTFSVNLKSQTISPSPNQEYCPEVEYTFTVTITKPFQNIIGESGSIVTQQPSLPVGSTFIFKGKFGDANQKQSFRVTFSDGSSYPFEFKKIKSLYYPVTCSQVPNQATITAPRCQVVNIPLTVPNVQWGTNFESPTFCFGSISDFEYQLPANWSIGTSQSIGSNWIPGGNTVTVTTDMSTGDGGYIRIRPRNNCGSGLVNSQFPGAIPISRPGPNLTISTLQDYICTVGGTTSFTLNGLPTGASVSWAVTSNSSQLQILGCFNCSIVTVQRTGSLNTKATLVATVTDCAFTYTQSYDVTLGKTELNTLDIISSFCLSERNVKVQVNPIDHNASYTWSVTPPAQLSIYTGSPFTFVRSYVTPSTPTVTVQAQNACAFQLIHREFIWKDVHLVALRRNLIFLCTFPQILRIRILMFQLRVR